MAYLATAIYTGDGAQTNFIVSFPYMNPAHILATVAGVPRSYTWIDPGTIQISPAPASGAEVKVYRNTSREYQLVDFEAGVPIIAQELDTAYLHAFYVAQEAFDVSNVSLVSGEVAAYAAAAAASAAAAAASETSADAANISAGAASTAAATSATEAGVSATSAGISAINADASATEAAGYAASINPALFLTKADNLASVASQQTALNNLTNVGIASNFDYLVRSSGGDVVWATPDWVKNTGGAINGDFTLLNDSKILIDNAGGLSGRPAFQAEEASTSTAVDCIPGSGATWAAFNVFGGTDRTNASNFQFAIDSSTTECFLKASKQGSGAYQPINFYTSDVLRFQIATSGQVAFYYGAGFSDTVTFNKTVHFFTIYDDGSSGTSKTIDFTVRQYHKITMTGNCTFTFTAPAGPTTVQLELIQDGTGSRTMTLPASVKWPGNYTASDKLLSTAASARDLLILRWNGTDYVANLIKAIA